MMFHVERWLLGWACGSTWSVGREAIGLRFHVERSTLSEL
jgi:hypothetical protein